MPERQRPQTPFVLGKPIKTPADFYGRESVRRDLFQAVLNGQLVAVVGEHRCGNTSIIYQMLHPDVRAEHLSSAEDAGLLFAFVSSQLAAESPRALLRRISRTLRRSDPDAGVSFDDNIDRRWFEAYLEDLALRNRKLVLLMDEFESLAHFPEGFWEWFHVVVSEYDVSIVATTRQDLGYFRAETGEGPAFFNLFINKPVGSFSEATFERFLRDKSELTDFDFMAVKDVIYSLAGRYPYYLQLASALFYLNDPGSEGVSQALIDEVVNEFKVRTSTLFDDAWQKLPATERELLAWIVLDMHPPVRDTRDYREALERLERRGYVLDGHIFSTAFVDYIRSHLRRIGVSDTGHVRVARELVDLGPDAVALLRYLLDHEGRAISRAETARAVWLADDSLSPADANARLESALAQLREALDADTGDLPHIELIDEKLLRFRNEEMVLSTDSGEVA